MQKTLLICLIFLLFSCGKDSMETEQTLSGTWTLSSVSGTCLAIPINASGNEIGCIDLPALEVNCSIIEFAIGGTLTYAYDLVQGNGTYTTDGEKINVCTDRCLTYVLDGNILLLETGTNSLCDPTYTFAKSTTSLDDLITINRRQFISSVSKNGSIVNSYSYNADGSLQSSQRFRDNGDLYYTDAYTFTPLTATRVRSFASSGNNHRYEYYNEAIDRTRRDFYGSSGQLEQYKLYFHGNSDCWVDRTESYQNGSLQDLTNYTYSGPNCNLEWNNYNGGELTSTYISQRDGKKFWAESTLLNILQNNNTGNSTSVSWVKQGELDKDSSYSSVFTYDDGDYPTTEIRTYLDGTVDLYTFSYQ